jgi:hypothetical protein
MSSPIISLAIVEGYWGQMFEYWPFTFLIAITIVYSVIAFGSDIFSKRRWKTPSGATPRMEFEIDPSVIARIKFRKGVYLLRFGSMITLAAATLFCYLAFFPLAIGGNYGLTQDVNNATATGTSIGVVSGALMTIAAIYIRKITLPFIAVIAAGLVVAIFAPTIANGEVRWLGIMLAALGIPIVMISYGTILATKHYAGTKRPVAYIAPSISTPPVGVA